MLKLIIGNQNYSSWSLRPWLLLKAFDIEFEQQVVSLASEGMSARLAQFSKSAKVPILVDGDLTIWDTLAISEYISETYLGGKGWPLASNERAIARAMVAEMHSGFGNLRDEMPMNIRARRKITLTTAALKDIAHIDEIWSQSRADGYLFGDYGIVDCFFSPVASRFNTYGVELSDKAQAYCERLLAHSAMRKWTKMALKEIETLAADETGEPA